MAKSSCAVALLLAGWGVEAGAEPLAAGPVTAEAAMKHYREAFGAPADSGCPEPGRATDEEIVICGRHGGRHPYRLELPIEREPGEAVRHINEPGNAVEAMRGPGCLRACQEPAKINIISVIFAAPKILRHILGKDD
jgi:hypothetical protein